MNLQELMQNPVWQAFLAAIAILSFIITIWALIKSRKRVELSDYCVSRTIISAGKGFIPDLQMVFRGKPVDRITATRFILWNSGTEKLVRADIVDEKPPRIYCTKSGARILDASIVKETEETNHFAIEGTGEQEVRLGFEYLNRQDGIVVQIVHTGHSASLAFDYKLKGGTEKQRMKKPRNKYKIGTTIMEIVYVCILSISVWFIPFSSASHKRLAAYTAVILIALGYVGLWSRLERELFRNYKIPSSQNPKTPFSTTISKIFSSAKIPKTLLAEVEFKSDDI